MDAMKKLLEEIDYEGCPMLYRGGLRRYLEEKIRPGHFLSAVLENDLAGAINRFSGHELSEVKALVIFVYNELPDASWGSEEKVAKWLAGDCRHGISKVDRCFECDGNLGTEDRR